MLCVFGVFFTFVAVKILSIVYFLLCTVRQISLYTCTGTINILILIIMILLLFCCGCGCFVVVFG